MTNTNLSLPFSIKALIRPEPQKEPYVSVKVTRLQGRNWNKLINQNAMTLNTSPKLHIAHCHYSKMRDQSPIFY